MAGGLSPPGQSQSDAVSGERPACEVFAETARQFGLATARLADLLAHDMVAIEARTDTSTTC